MSAKLNHARVLVVGGSSGIGLATAAAAAEAGAAVTIASRSQTKLESAVSTLGKSARAICGRFRPVSRLLGSASLLIRHLGGFASLGGLGIGVAQMFLGLRSVLIQVGNLRRMGCELLILIRVLSLGRADARFHRSDGLRDIFFGRTTRT